MLSPAFLGRHKTNATVSSHYKSGTCLPLFFFCSCFSWCSSRARADAERCPLLILLLLAVFQNKSEGWSRCRQAAAGGRSPLAILHELFLKRGQRSAEARFASTSASRRLRPPRTPVELPSSLPQQQQHVPHTRPFTPPAPHASKHTLARRRRGGPPFSHNLALVRVRFFWGFALTLCVLGTHCASCSLVCIERGGTALITMFPGVFNARLSRRSPLFRTRPTNQQPALACTRAPLCCFNQQTHCAPYLCVFDSFSFRPPESVFVCYSARVMREGGLALLESGS